MEIVLIRQFNLDVCIDLPVFIGIFLIIFHFVRISDYHVNFCIRVTAADLFERFVDVAAVSSLFGLIQRAKMFGTCKKVVDAAKEDDDVRVAGDILISVNKGIVIFIAVKRSSADAEIDNFRVGIFGNKIRIIKSAAVRGQRASVSGRDAVAQKCDLFILQGVSTEI